MSTVQFDDVTTFVLVLIGLMTFIVLTFNVSQAIKTWMNQGKEPIKDHEERLDDLEEWRKDVDRKLAGDWEFRQKTEDFEKLTLTSLRIILRSIGHGNAEVEKQEEKLDKYLIEGRYDERSEY